MRVAFTNFPLPFLLSPPSHASSSFPSMTTLFVGFVSRDPPWRCLRGNSETRACDRGDGAGKKSEVTAGGERETGGKEEQELAKKNSMLRADLMNHTSRCLRSTGMEEDPRRAEGTCTLAEKFRPSLPPSCPASSFLTDDEKTGERKSPRPVSRSVPLSEPLNNSP